MSILTSIFIQAFVYWRYILSNNISWGEQEIFGSATKLLHHCTTHPGPKALLDPPPANLSRALFAFEALALTLR